MKKTLGFASVLALTAALALTATEVSARGKGNPHDQPVVYVTSQGLYYDSTITTNLPPRGPFQQLDPEGGPHGGPQTEFGPGDHGYVGGRWWVDVDGGGEMDDGDVYFSCPLHGPGRENP